ncbi:MAG: CDP-alcohol phosphatidyltransferase family protein [Erysipelotrichales bacterium]|nr:CDP-alcohol phosphatidyltransferase family protein [Erysipelotrichales bacterium]
MKKFVNALTISRLLATFIMPVLWFHINPIYLIILVSLILLTDFFDGFLARTFHVQSLFGMIMDVVADKAFGIMIVLILSGINPIFYIPLCLEILIALINLTAAILGARTKSSFLGRTKMWFLGISIFFGILAIFKSEILGFIHVEIILDFLNYLVINIDSILFGSVFLTAGTEFMVAIDYLRRILKELKTKKEKVNYKLKPKDELMIALFDTKHYTEHKYEPISNHIFTK